LDLATASAETCGYRAMKASELEYRHQTLVHLLIVGMSFLTYLVDRDDVVWVVRRGRPGQDLLERALFAVAAILMGVGALLRTWAGASADASRAVDSLPVPSDGPYRYVRYPRQLGSLLFSIGLGFLTPIAGFVLLVVGETLVTVRLILHERALVDARDSSERAAVDELAPTSEAWPGLRVRTSWGEALRRESGKWGLFLTMIVFSLLLRDRVAEVLAGASFLVCVVLNCGSLTGRVARS
jgi:protein-S-isoprenylcysteine O-methyltransferase Ste14